MSFTEPRLPPELEREIFETTSELHPSMTPSLLRVSKRVLQWIGPMVFRNIILSDSEAYDLQLVQDALIRAAEQKSASFLANGVRRLVLDEVFGLLPVSKGFGPAIQRCTGVTHLAVWEPDIDDLPDEVVRAIVRMPLRRLSSRLHRLLESDMSEDPAHFASLPFLRNLTHLDIFEGELERLLLSLITTLPFLTHLAISFMPSPALFRRLLIECTKLESFVVLAMTTEYRSAIPDSFLYPLKDILDTFDVQARRDLRCDRFTIVNSVLWYEGVLPDVDADGQPGNFWARAQEYIDEKRRGAISDEDNSFWVTYPW
ncbi:hypothetical protein MKEN_00290600 [Mycena kentingensis (nom. inval.)]|nr:hypothetical protein MKEN_00290600 [Mycena kentingensis (nom. inval.)]